MTLQELLEEMVKLSEELRHKQRYIGIQQSYTTRNWEGNQNNEEVLEEVCKRIEEIVAKYIVHTPVVPSRRINSILRNQCIAKQGVMPMSRI